MQRQVAVLVCSQFSMSGMPIAQSWVTAAAGTPLCTAGSLVTQINVLRTNLRWSLPKYIVRNWGACICNTELQIS